MENEREPTKNNDIMKEILDDLCSRFILNCPDEAYDSYERLFFQIEEAHWFYEDFYREQQKSLPEYKFKEFVKLIFNHCPLLSCNPEDVEKHLENFLHYKQRVNVYGAIILNETLDKVLLVKGWYARSSWGFPKGKINKDEDEVSCAVREVYEEIGYDIKDKIDPKEFIQKTIREQYIKLYIIYGVPENTNFQTQTRKEISKIQWHNINDIGKSMNGKKSVNRYWSIMPFIKDLKKKISMKLKENRRRTTGKRVPKSMTFPKTKSLKMFNDYEIEGTKGVKFGKFSNNHNDPGQKYISKKASTKDMHFESISNQKENTKFESQLNMKTGTSMRNFSFNKDVILSTIRQRVTTSV